MRKKWWLAISLLMLSIVGAGVFFLTPPAPGVTYANFSRLEQGMTRSQVEACLGKPNEGPGSQIGPMGEPDRFAVLNEPGWSNWQNEAGDFVSVKFDGDDRANVMTWNGWTDD